MKRIASEQLYVMAMADSRPTNHQMNWFDLLSSLTVTVGWRRIHKKQ
jgi:hypothetical protein